MAANIVWPIPAELVDSIGTSGLISLVSVLAGHSLAHVGGIMVTLLVVRHGHGVHQFGVILH